MRRVFSLGAAIALVTGLLAAPVAMAQGAPHTAAIHSGTCSDPGEIVASLSGISPQLIVDGVPASADSAVGTDAAAPIMTSVTTISMRFADLLSANHSIVIGDGPGGAGQRIACGDIGTGFGDPDLAIRLRGASGSGQVGAAWLSDDGAGSTVVRISVVDAASPNESTAGADSTTCVTDHSVTLNKDLSYAGWGVTIVDASFEPESGEVLINALFTNDTNRGDLRGRSIGRTFIERDQQVLPLTLGESSSFISGQTVRVALANAPSAPVPGDFSFCDAILTFGRPTEYQASLRLVPDAVAEFDMVRELDAKGTARLKGLDVRFRLHGGSLMPAECGSHRGGGAFFNGPLTTDKISLVLDVTETIGRVTGNITKSLVAPDGVSWPIESRRVSGPKRNERQYCVVIPAPAEGRYKLVFEGGRRTGRVAFEIPPVDEVAP